MHIRTAHFGVLNYGTRDQIRDVFRKSLKEAGYIPTSNLQVLVTPTGSVMGALRYFQPDLAKAMGDILWQDAKTANALAGQVILRPTTTTQIAPTIKPLPLPTTAPAPTTAIKLPLMRLPTTAPTAAAAPTAPTMVPMELRTGEMIPVPVEEEKKIPWVWIGVGAVVVGGVLLFALRK
jgi:hypothetical protein